PWILKRANCFPVAARQHDVVPRVSPHPTRGGNPCSVSCRTRAHQQVSRLRLPCVSPGVRDFQPTLAGFISNESNGALYGADDPEVPAIRTKRANWLRWSVASAEWHQENRHSLKQERVGDE